jgi:hypothetical protein
MINLFNQCPACGGPIIVTECQCLNCKLQMRGEFQLGQFSLLSADQLAFIRVFLSARGNLTEVERVLGISYPTIRNKLDEINAALNKTIEKKTESSHEPSPDKEEERQAILQKVAEGKLSASEALEQLQKLKGENQ